MRLPTKKKRDPWPRRRAEPEPEPGQSIPRKWSIEAGDNELVTCAACKTRNVVRSGTDLTERLCIHCQTPLAYNRGSKLTTLFDRVTGIRKRTRQRLGYRRALSAFELEVDPNVHLEGERLRRAMEEWLAENHTPWDRDNPRRIANWTDHPVVRLTIVALGGTLLVAGILVVQRVKSENATFSRGEPLPAIDPAANLRELAPKEFERAKPVAEYFLAADTTKLLLSVVRDRDRVEPLIEAHYANRPLQPIEYRELTLVDAADFAGRVFLRIAVELPDGQFAGLTLERGAEHYRVDWESFVGHSDVDWKTFKAGAPNDSQPVRLRAYASFIEQYESPFEDSRRYQSVGLLGQDGESLIGYIERFDPKYIELRAKMAEAGKNRYEIIVRVRYPQEGWKRDEVEILEILQTGWVEWDRMPAPPELAPDI